MAIIPHSKPTITSADIRAVKNQVATGMIASGVIVNQFEQAFLHYLNASTKEFALFTNSGTDALLLILQDLNITQGDEILLPSYVCPELLSPIRQLGAIPTYYDNAPSSWITNVTEIKNKITPHTKAIIVVHTFGIAVDFSPLLGNHIPIIEDCAHALGTKQATGEHVGLLGDYALFSFHATKCMTTGEGGMLISKSPIKNPQRTSAISAALGLSQLQQFPTFLEKRNTLANLYTKLLNIPKTYDERNWFRFPIQVNERFDDIHNIYASNNIAIRKGVDTLLHQAEGLSDSKFPHATHAFTHTISLPIYPTLRKKDVERICNIFIKNNITLY